MQVPCIFCACRMAQSEIMRLFCWNRKSIILVAVRILRLLVKRRSKLRFSTICASVSMKDQGTKKNCSSKKWKPTFLKKSLSFASNFNFVLSVFCLLRKLPTWFWYFASRFAVWLSSRFVRVRGGWPGSDFQMVIAMLWHNGKERQWKENSNPVFMGFFQAQKNSTRHRSFSRIFSCLHEIMFCTIFSRSPSWGSKETLKLITWSFLPAGKQITNKSTLTCSLNAVRKKMKKNKRIPRNFLVFFFHS